jgi:hypothetical protein
VEQFCGQGTPIRRAFLGIGERLLDRCHRFCRVFDGCRRRREQLDVLGRNIGLADELWHRDPNEWTVQQQVFEPDRAVVGNQHIRRHEP